MVMKMVKTQSSELSNMSAREREGGRDRERDRERERERERVQG